MKKVKIELIENEHGVLFRVDGYIINMPYEKFFDMVELLEGLKYEIIINQYYD